jgi:hypothetical protein
MGSADQTAAIQFFDAIFQFHVQVHGRNFGQPHRFLSDLVFSFFLCANPGPYFEAAIVAMRPIVRDAPEWRLKYGMVDDNRLIRREYWMHCHEAAGELVNSMRSCADLLPVSVRILLTLLGALGLGDFAIDGTFCRFLTHELLTEEAHDIRDVCIAIDSGAIIDAFTIEPGAYDPLAISVYPVDAASLFSPRDLQVVFNAVSLFIKFCDATAAQDVEAKAFSGLTPPTHESEDEICLLNNWKREKSSERPVEKPPPDFGDLIDCLTTIDFRKLNYATPQDLASSALRYCSQSLNWYQRLLVGHTSEIADRLVPAVETSHLYRQDLKRISSRLFRTLFVVTSSRQQRTSHSLQLLQLLMRRRIVPLLYEMYPAEFDFTAASIFAAKKTLKRVFKAILTRIVSLELPPAHNLLLQKVIMTTYMDQLERMFDFQVGVTNEEVDATLLRNFMKIPTKFTFSKFQDAMISRAADIFGQVRMAAPPSVNLQLVLTGMGLMNGFQDEAIKRAVCLARTPSLFSFSVFWRTYVTNPKMISTMLSRGEIALIQKFVANVTVLIKEIGTG